MSGFAGGGDGQSGFSSVELGSIMGNSLQSLLMCDDIVPGTEPSYQLCKTIFLSHPLGIVLASAPINMAQSQRRDIAIPSAPEEMIVKAFNDQWDKDGADRHIANCATLSRVYGLAGIVYGVPSVDTKSAIKPERIQKAADLYFNVLDPLNMSGSMVMQQDPNSPNYQKPALVTAAGQAYHPSRGIVFLNGDPIYIAYTGSSFGYTGRSVYQPILLPLKSFVQSMRTDDLVLRKAGIIIAKITQPGSVVNGVMSFFAATRRFMLKEAQTDNVISIGPTDEITTLDLTNVDKATTSARKNVLENCATGSKMPSVIVNNQTYAEGFGEGSEDAKAVARWVENYRREIKPLYDYFDRIIQLRAWTPEFYESVQKAFPEAYAKKKYEQAFYEWTNNFTPSWPNLLTEPESEKSKTEKVKFDSLIALLEKLQPLLDPDNLAELVQWVVDSANQSKLLFEVPLNLDVDSLLTFLKKNQKAQEDAAKQQQQAMAEGGQPGAPGSGKEAPDASKEPLGK